MNLEKIGSFIKDIRKEKGLTQEQLAEKLGVSQKSVSRWETGKTMPDYSLLPVICEVLEINVAELLGAERISGDSVPKKQVTAMAQNMILLVNNKSHVRKIVGAILSAVIMLVGVVGLYNYEYSVSVDSTADLEKAINECGFLPHGCGAACCRFSSKALASFLPRMGRSCRVWGRHSPTRFRRCNMSEQRILAPR